MEFKFRAIDGQASTSIPPPSSIGCFTEQALRAGYSVPDFGRSTEFFRNSSNVREAIQRELEKERIREEIIAAEIVRMCLLEAEVRREMALGREMALRREEGFSVFSGPAATSAMRFEPRPSLLHQSEEGRLLEERLALSLEERLGYRPLRSVGGFKTVPFLRNAEPKIYEIKPPSEVSKESHFRDKQKRQIEEDREREAKSKRDRAEDDERSRRDEEEDQRRSKRRTGTFNEDDEQRKGAKTTRVPIGEANPEGNLSGAKRKAMTLPAADASELPSGSLKKILKEEWSCALCQVNATSERGFDEHLQGQKHKAMAAGLRVLRMGKNQGWI